MKQRPYDPWAPFRRFAAAACILAGLAAGEGAARLIDTSNGSGVTVATLGRPGLIAQVQKTPLAVAFRLAGNHPFPAELFWFENLTESQKANVRLYSRNYVIMLAAGAIVGLLFFFILKIDAKNRKRSF